MTSRSDATVIGADAVVFGGAFMVIVIVVQVTASASRKRLVSFLVVPNGLKAMGTGTVPIRKLLTDRHLPLWMLVAGLMPPGARLRPVL